MRETLRALPEFNLASGAPRSLATVDSNRGVLPHEASGLGRRMLGRSLCWAGLMGHAKALVTYSARTSGKKKFTMEEKDKKKIKKGRDLGPLSRLGSSYCLDLSCLARRLMKGGTTCELNGLGGLEPQHGGCAARRRHGMKP